LPDRVRFLADECCDTGLTGFLRKKGYDVSYISEQETGAGDDAVLQKAYTESRILITEDKDFGELVFRLRKLSTGVILIRIPVKQRHLKFLRLEKLTDEYSDRLSGHFVVVDTDKFRFRPLLSIVTLGDEKNKKERKDDFVDENNILEISEG